MPVPDPATIAADLQADVAAVKAVVADVQAAIDDFKKTVGDLHPSVQPAAQQFAVAALAAAGDPQRMAALRTHSLNLKALLDLLKTLLQALGGLFPKPT